MNAPARLAVVAALAAAACTPRPPTTPAAGRTLADGPATGLSASPDGSRLAWLSACAPAGGTGGASCALVVAPAAGGTPSKVADGVAPGASPFAWGPDGTAGALSRRDPVTGAGALTVQRLGREPRVVSPRASAFALGPAGAVAWADDGALRVEWPGREPSTLRGGAGAVEVAFAPAPARAVAARLRGPDGAPVLLLWRNLDGEPAVVARDVGTWAFSPDGAWLAALAGVVPGSEGDLVAVSTEAATAPVSLARGAGEFRWGPRGAGLGWLQAFDPRVRAGTLATGRPGQPPVARGDRVTSWELAPGGEVASVRHATSGGYSAILELAPAGGGALVELARDPAGMAFTADGRWLWYRASCAPAGDGCALYRAPAAGGGAPERLADGVVAFVLDPVRPDRALVSLARRDGTGVDLGLWAGGRVVPLDGPVVAASPVLAGPDGKRAAWISAAPGRAGVRAADLP